MLLCAFVLSALEYVIGTCAIFRCTYNGTGIVLLCAFVLFALEYVIGTLIYSGAQYRGTGIYVYARVSPVAGYNYSRRCLLDLPSLIYIRSRILLASECLIL